MRNPAFSARVHCESCWKEIVAKQNLEYWDKITLGEVQGKRRYQKNSRIRNLARALILKIDIPLVCGNCGYDKHVEIHHIKSISSFPLDTVIKIINSLNNLVLLCPNCHWEMEHNLIQVPAIGIEPTPSLQCSFNDLV